MICKTNIHIINNLIKYTAQEHTGYVTMHDGHDDDDGHDENSVFLSSCLPLRILFL